ncbi:MAG: ABC transporter permease [Armatimonadota bacterium]
MFKVILAVVRKDLLQYFMDRRAVLISLLVPLGIACFMAVIFGSQAASGGKPGTKITVLVAAKNRAEVAPLLNRWSKAESLTIKEVSEQEAKDQVKAGKAPLAVIIPSGFVAGAANAFGNSTAEKPELKFIADPTKNLESGIAKGELMGGIMGVIVENKYGKAFAMDQKENSPYTTKTDDLSEEKKQDATDDRNATIAHVFGGMAIQGILFGAIESAMLLMRDRQKGLLKRLTAAPISPRWFLLGRIFSSTIKALFVLCVVLIGGIMIFHFKITGSVIGLAVMLFGSALMTASFGLFVSALGRTEAQSRGLSTLVVLVMTMLGGAWFPASMFPDWVQSISKCIPVRWAVDGMDAMTWRGQELSAVLPFFGVLLLFTLGFAAIGLTRFRWDAE